RDQARKQERQPDRDLSDGPAVRRVQAVHLHLVCEHGQRDSGRDERKEERPHAARSSSSRILSPESLSFRTKPIAGLRRSRRPKSTRPRLETRMICDGPPESSSATSKPLRSGRTTSSRTRSGSTSRASVIAEVPSAASPTTAKPSLSSSRRAAARNG